LKDIIQLIAASPANPLLPNAESLLLGQDRRQFSVIFDQLDADKDKKLNAAELRSLFSLLFGDPVSTEHLTARTALSKAKFFAILEDYDESYGYNVGDDIFEFYNHFVQEESGRISPRRPVPGDLGDAAAGSSTCKLLARSSASSSTDEGSSVKHPLYQEMLAQRVASFQADRRDAGSLRCLLEKVAEELMAMFERGGSV
uniref:EF-hand domain-containing protein n=1 Tax=Macrostomum lignano TaxID=282301 RepID=A0A1I8GFK9_9PLAT